MALIVENGTGSATSESYCSVTDADTYHANRGNDAWAALSTPLKEQSLRKATDYLEQVYSQAWQGLRIGSVQALSFPRHSVFVNNYVIASDVIPKALINATAELALKAAAGELLSDLEQGVLREKVGALEVEYDKYSPRSKRYSAVEAMLKPLMQNSSGMYVGLIRA